MKSRKGFTLVELLGTIVILSLIVIVAFPAIISQMKKSNESIDSSVKHLVETAARDFMNDSVESYPKPLQGKTTTYGTKKVIDLIAAGYLEQTYADKHCKIKNDTITLGADDKKYIVTYNEVGGDDNC